MPTGINMTKESREEQHRLILAAIVGYKKEHGGISPTYQEIGLAVGLKSKSHVAAILKDMEEDGMIGRIGGQNTSRGITVPGEGYIAP